jgi:hypothetical protein
MNNALTTLSSNWKSVPTEVSHLILLFTGKFVFDKNGKLKSIVNLHDFENIEQHLGVFELFFGHHLLRKNEVEKFIMYLHKKVYNRPVMDEEERKREEILAFMNVDYNKHNLLFIKESPIEEVMIPLEPGRFCGECENKLTSVELTQRHKTIKTKNVFNNFNVWNMNGGINGFVYWYYNVVCLKPGQCRNCFELIKNKKEKKVEEKDVLLIPVKKYSEPRKISYLKNYNKVRTNNKKSFRMLK